MRGKKLERVQLNTIESILERLERLLRPESMTQPGLPVSQWGHAEIAMSQR
jgi:hypothetical protein